jgi:hypothetical protein
MGRMIKSKREYRCEACGGKFIKWLGVCPSCGKGGTLQEFMLVPVKKTNGATPSQKSLMRRSKNSERNIAKRMVAVDGADPNYQKIATSTGRIGHITNIRVDAISSSYVTENKNRTLPSWLTTAWLLINQRAEDFEKNALLHLDPPNMAKEFPINGTVKPLDTMAVITQTRHEELILKEKDLTHIKTIMSSEDNDLSKQRQIKELLGL